MPISNGRRALVDIADLPLIENIPWRCVKDYNTAYAIYGNGGRLRMHRVIMDAQPGEVIDHINGNGLDNRRCNLRRCTTADNARNSKKPRRKCTSRFKGVRRVKEGVWAAKISVNRKGVYLGHFKTEKEAALAYDEAAVRFFGDFARKNFEAPSRARHIRNPGVVSPWIHWSKNGGEDGGRSFAIRRIPIVYLLFNEIQAYISDLADGARHARAYRWHAIGTRTIGEGFVL